MGWRGWVIFYLYFALTTATETQYKFPNQTMCKAETSVNQVLPQTLKIKLAIFGDSDFANLFGNDRSKMLQYWEVVLYDVHLRLQTLPSFNFSLQVTNFYIFEKHEEYHDIHIGHKFQTVDQFTTEITDKFREWVYSNLDQLPSFHISILVMGSPVPVVNPIFDYTDGNRICQGPDHNKKVWRNSILLTMTPHPTEVIARSVASMLGAPFDMDADYWSICDASRLSFKRQCCIMTPRQHTMILELRYFSQCTDKILQTILRSNTPEELFCMIDDQLETVAFIDSAKLFQNPSEVHTYTFEEQCRILAWNRNVQFDNGHCLAAKCTSDELGSFVYSPLEGTACGNNSRGRCFRGYCVEHERQLMNLGTGKCLVSENGQFSSHDKPVLKDCSKIPFNKLHVSMGYPNKYRYMIALEYSGDKDTSLKFLQVERTLDSNLKFIASFSNENSVGTMNEWVPFTPNSEKPDEFVLINDDSQACARAAEDGYSVEFVSICTTNDTANLWKFVTPGEKIQENNSFAAGLILPLSIASTFAAISVMMTIEKMYKPKTVVKREKIAKSTNKRSRRK